MQISCTTHALFREPEMCILKQAIDDKYRTNTFPDFVVSNWKGEINFNKVVSSPEPAAPHSAVKTPSCSTLLVCCPGLEGGSSEGGSL